MTISVIFHVLQIGTDEILPIQLSANADNSRPCTTQSTQPVNKIWRRTAVTPRS